MRWRSTGPGSMPSDSSRWRDDAERARGGGAGARRWATWRRLVRCGGAAHVGGARRARRGCVVTSTRIEELRRRAERAVGGRAARVGPSRAGRRLVGSGGRSGAMSGEHRWEQLHAARRTGAGRQADALRAFQDARHTLTEELGIEPSPALRALEQAVLVQDPSLEAPPRSPPERPRHNLPAALTSLVGREDDLRVNAEAGGGVPARHADRRGWGLEDPPGHPGRDGSVG